MKMVVSIYKTRHKEGVYLYVNKRQGISCIPPQLRTLMGEHPEHVMDLLLTPERQLAHAAPTEVITNIKQNGYYVQMPPFVDK